MCGICGVYHFATGTPVREARLHDMCDMITHRGPDEDGYHVDGPVGLAMRRLIIIDPETGKQPLYNEDRSIALVFNGEIYNFEELRSRLQDQGHRFRSRGDGEAIVHLYDEYGLECLQHLRGMFAFALWDEPRGRLLIARDRLGIKPLYYGEHNGSLFFGSEQKAVLRHPTFPRAVDEVALHHYLSLNYVPSPFSLVKNMRQLHPGEYLLADADGVKTNAYWDLRFQPDETPGEAEWVRRVRDKLDECVHSHLVSDVPFGAFLSGGIDSSAVVGFMASHMKEPVSTFSIDFKEDSYSEARYAQQVADQFHCRHRVFEVTADVVSLIDTLIWHADDPLADSSMLPVYMLARKARDHVKMVLTGDGGDEVFAGYPTYNAYFVRQLYRRFPRFVRRGLVARLVNALPVSLSKVSFDFKAKRFVEGAELSAAESHFWWRSILTEAAKHRLYSPRLREQLADTRTAALYDDYFARSGTDDPLSRMLYTDTRFYLPADMLAKVDRMTMANALEARVPFLDHEMVELGARMPSDIKFKGREKKYILKRALEGMLGRDILDRKKAGFNVPVNAWLAGELNSVARSILAPERVDIHGLLQPVEIGRLFAEHEARKVDHSYALWGLLCFQIWYERFIAPDVVRPPQAVAERWNLQSRAGS